MSNGEFQTYFQRRASRFAAFYASEPVARLLGRGPLFDRLRLAVETAVCHRRPSGFSMSGVAADRSSLPWPSHGIHVIGIDPAEAMVALADEQATEFPDLIEVEQRGWEEIDRGGRLRSWPWRSASSTTWLTRSTCWPAWGGRPRGHRLVPVTRIAPESSASSGTASAASASTATARTVSTSWPSGAGHGGGRVCFRWTGPGTWSNSGVARRRSP